MMRRELLDGERIFVVHDLLSIDECAALLLRSEDMVFERGHRDGAHLRIRERQESRLTFKIYFSDDVVGGATRFFLGMEDAFAGRAWLTVAPRSGKALIFEHRVWHEGAPVEQGRKVVLRTDVMYGRPGR